MGLSGEMFLRMREEDFNNLSEPQRELFTYVEKVEVNEYELHKADPYYLALYKEKSKASKKLKAYLFDKRHEIIKQLNK
jgi:hypothetical protein